MYNGEEYMDINIYKEGYVNFGSDGNSSKTLACLDPTTFGEENFLLALCRQPNTALVSNIKSKIIDCMHLLL